MGRRLLIGSWIWMAFTLVAILAGAPFMAAYTGIICGTIFGAGYEIVKALRPAQEGEGR